MTFDQLTKIVLTDIRHNIAVFLVGNPGIGKSSWIKYIAANHLKSACFCLSCNQLGDKCDVTGARMVPVMKQVTDASGNPVLDAYGNPAMETVSWQQEFFPHQVIMAAVNYAKEHPAETPVLFLDEINRTNSDITSELLSLTTERAIGNTALPANLVILSAGNDGNENVTALDKASISRYAMYHVEPDLPTFLKANPGLNPYVKATLSKNPSYLYLDKEVTGISQTAGKKDDDDDDENAVFDLSLGESMTQITTPRTLTALSEWLNDYNGDELKAMMNVQDGDHSMLQSIIEAHVGPTAFTLALLDEILSSSVIMPTAQTTITAPANYPLFIACQTRDEMMNMVAAMSEQEKSQMLLYCCYDGRDNSVPISILAPATNLTPGDMANFISMSQAKTLNRGNIDALYSVNCSLTNICHMMNL